LIGGIGLCGHGGWFAFGGGALGSRAGRAPFIDGGIGGIGGSSTGFLISTGGLTITGAGGGISGSVGHSGGGVTMIGGQGGM
jgi:hypothetical protein